MKQTLLLLFLLSILSFQTQAQISSTVNPNGIGLSLTPDSSSNLPHAMEGVPYVANIQFKVPSSMMYLIGGMPFNVIVNDVTINKVSGLSAVPNTNPFSFTTNPISGVFPAGQTSTIQLSGTPAIGCGDSAFNLKVRMTIHGHIEGSNQILNIDSTISFYRLGVDLNMSAPSVSKSRFDMTQNYPNPFKNKTSVSFNVPIRTSAEFLVYNIVGNVLYKKTIDAKPGVNIINFDASDFQPGVYFYSISNGSAVLTKRLIIDRNN